MKIYRYELHGFADSVYITVKEEERDKANIQDDCVEAPHVVYLTEKNLKKAKKEFVTKRMNELERHLELAARFKQFANEDLLAASRILEAIVEDEPGIKPL